MPEVNSSDILKKLKANELSNVYYIYGKDILTVEGITKAVLKKTLGKNWNNDCTKIEGKNIDISSLIDIMEISPMFSDFNAILINDLNAEELSADKVQQLIDAIENLPDQTVLIINITGFDVKNGKRFFSGKNKKLTDCIMKNKFCTGGNSPQISIGGTTTWIIALSTTRWARFAFPRTAAGARRPSAATKISRSARRKFRRRSSMRSPC